VVTRAEDKIAEIQDALEGITRRAANLRAGHVYVISNVGAFGQTMVKIGMTRRLKPEERVYELGDASVPFLLGLNASITDWVDEPEALEWRQSERARRHPQTPEPVPVMSP
jgi:hypothetical protein